MIGPLPPNIPSRTNPVGGTGLHFRETIRELSERAVDIQVIDTTRPRANMGRIAFLLNAIATVLKIALAALRRTKSCNVVFVNLTAGRLWLLGPLFWIICASFHRPMILRVFGGEFADAYDGYSSLIRWLANHTFMRCARIYVQTKAIARRFHERPNIRWFPNTRDVQVQSTRSPSTAKRLLFVAQLRKEKGLSEALKACRQLPDGCHLSVFGPRIGGLDVELMVEHNHASYGGVLRPDDVPSVIADHDVVLLPTYFASEGYPGIIIEAFQCGRPVISTWWKSIPEVVQHQRNGLLVAPRSSAGLREAILRLVADPTLYQNLSVGARKRGELFRSRVWYDRLVNDIASVCEESSRNG